MQCWCWSYWDIHHHWPCVGADREGRICGHTSSDPESEAAENNHGPNTSMSKNTVIWEWLRIFSSVLTVLLLWQTTCAGCICAVLHLCVCGSAHSGCTQCCLSIICNMCCDHILYMCQYSNDTILSPTSLQAWTLFYKHSICLLNLYVCRYVLIIHSRSSLFNIQVCFTCNIRCWKKNNALHCNNTKLFRHNLLLLLEIHSTNTI